MCGIVGAVSIRKVSPLLLSGLQRLEYRGYDSAGVAVMDDEANLSCLRCQGKVLELITKESQQPLGGTLGIAHTRWATHGKPCEENAHPHMSSDDIALVHNGIVENHDSLRERLKSYGYAIRSETDTEVIVHLIHHLNKETKSFVETLAKVSEQLNGAYACGIIHKAEANSLYAMRRGSPLVIGFGDDEMFIASDPLALNGMAHEVMYLEDGDIARLTKDSVEIFSGDLTPVRRHKESIKTHVGNTTKGEYRHYMLKEIFEQPQVIADTLQGRLTENGVFAEAFGDKAPELFKKTQHIHIVACGTSYHAGLVAKYWLEKLTDLPTSVEVASEYRYRRVVVPENTLFITVSQSGETADTLAALKKAKALPYLTTLAICNVPTSSLVRESDLVCLTRAGVEIGVASTKAFTTQLCVFVLLTMSLMSHKDKEKTIAKALLNFPSFCESLLKLNKEIQEVARDFVEKEHALYLGRGKHYPVALEGALKLKEISYIHAEAYPAGELKHGPLALVDEGMPVICVAPNDKLLEKLKANLSEVSARGGRLYVFACKGLQLENSEHVTLIEIPEVERTIAPIAYTIPLQLLAYHVAVLKGTDVDQPRNLAKSVTVE